MATRRVTVWAVFSSMVAGLLLVTPPPAAAGPGESASRADSRGARARRGPMRGRRGSKGMRGGPTAVVPRSEFEAAYLHWNTFHKRSLMATASGTQEGAKRPMSQARERWYEFLGKYYEAPPPEFAEDAHWQSNLAAITGYHHVAEWHLHAGRMDEAHETLEQVRWVWLELRARNGVSWFGDALSRYRAVMEPVVGWGTGAEHGGVTPDNIEDFEVEVLKLLEAWRRLTQHRPPLGNMRRFSFGMQQEARALAEFEEVVAARLYDDIAEAAKEVNTAFTMLFMGFG